MDPKLASPAADWLPTGLRQPPLPKGTLIFCTNATTGGESSRAFRVEEFTEWHNLSHYRLVAPLPAQPADASKCPHGSNDNGSRCIYCIDAKTPGGFIGHLQGNRPGMQQHMETRTRYKLAPGERAEATINAGPEMGESASLAGRVEKRETATTATQLNASPAPAPQRQNLDMPPNCRAFDELLAEANRDHPEAMAKARKWVQQTFKPLPELRSAVLAREVTEMRRSLRGRAPWPESPRAILSSLPVNAFKEWK